MFVVLPGPRLAVRHAAARVVTRHTLDRAQHEAARRQLHLLVDAVEIPRLLAALQEGHDLVSGWKRERRDPLGKRLASFIQLRGDRAKMMHAPSRGDGKRRLARWVDLQRRTFVLATDWLAERYAPSLSASEFRDETR